jgi:hypothetical protein
MQGSDKYLWPQENRTLMKERIKKNRLNVKFSLKRFFRLFPDFLLLNKTLLAFLGIGNFKKMELKLMYIFNGRGTQALSDKYHFLEICHKLNFGAPNQILLMGDESSEERKKLFLEKFNEDGFGFYIKPVGGYLGKGIRVLNTRDEVLNVINEIKEKTVIEDAINIDKEFRYILYKDPDGNNWHMSFEKIRFYVIGDGKSNIFNLIIKNNFIPWRRKIALFKNKFRLMIRIVPKNEKVMLENRCSYGRLPSNGEISALDKYAPVLINKLEKEIGHKLPIICFDLGVKKPLKKDMDFGKLNAIIAPFECQLPFSPLAHFKFMKGGFWPFLDFYKMLVGDMFDTVNKRI